MTEFLIEANARKSGPYTAAGGQTAFVYDFPIYDEADIGLWKLPLGATASTRLVLGTHYTVTGVGELAGGTIVLVAGATAGDIYTLVGARVARRATDFSQDGEFTAADLNRDLDLLATTMQEMQTALGSAIRANSIDDDMDGELPPASVRAGKWLGFDGNGDPTVGTPGTLALADGDVTGPKIAAGAVTGPKIAAAAVDGTKIADGAVDSTKLAADATTQRPTRRARLFSAMNLS